LSHALLKPKTTQPLNESCTIVQSYNSYSILCCGVADRETVFTLVHEMVQAEALGFVEEHQLNAFSLQLISNVGV